MASRSLITALPMFFLFKSLADSSEERYAIFHTIARAWFQLRESRKLVAVNYIYYALADHYLEAFVCRSRGRLNCNKKHYIEQIIN